MSRKNVLFRNLFGVVVAGSVSLAARPQDALGGGRRRRRLRRGRRRRRRRRHPRPAFLRLRLGSDGGAACGLSSDGGAAYGLSGDGGTTYGLSSDGGSACGLSSDGGAACGLEALEAHALETLASGVAHLALGFSGHKQNRNKKKQPMFKKMVASFNCDDCFFSFTS